ncbi:unnamed protein product [Prorocentrum cordatum]|uniref:Uncharacterized protein n=1 Tax=Prorocentrum cordatum TaxID=2364126 RepID=A0ABN9S8Q0_9DINO|nr:unnamed protein product [Polarella glacialis]
MGMSACCPAWESGGPPSPLLALAECDAFVEALLPAQGPGPPPEQALHGWRLAALGGAGPGATEWNPLAFRAVFSVAPEGAASEAFPP